MRKSVGIFFLTFPSFPSLFPLLFIIYIFSIKHEKILVSNFRYKASKNFPSKNLPTLLPKSCSKIMLVSPSVVDPNTLNLDPDPKFWLYLNPDPGL